ncbi:MAG: extracellular solute-binding protein [Planctomycetota bacterium]
MTFAKAARFLLAFAALLAVVWSFVHVGQRTYKQWDRDRKDTRTVLTILHWGDNAEVEIVDKLVKAFEADNPDIRINRVHASDYDAKLNTLFAAGDPPDLFYLKFDMLPKLAGMGLLTPLDERVEADRLAGDPWIDSFYPVVLDAFQFDGKEIGKGPLYGVAKDFTTMLFYVNVDLFNRAGVAVPYDGWTWSEFEDAARKITALEDPNGQVYGAVLATWPDVLRHIVWAFGGDYFNGADFHDVQLDSPGTIASLEAIRTLRFEDNTVYNATTGDAQGLGEQEFFTGRIGMVGPIGRWRTPRFRSIDDFKWDVVPSPTTPGVDPVSAIATVAWSMSSTTEHPDEAYRLLKFLCGPVGQKLTAESGLAIPCIREVAESDAFLRPDLAPANARLFLDLIDAARLGQMPEEAEFARIMQEEVEKSIRLNQQDPAEAARRVEDRWLTELDAPLRNDTFPIMPWGWVGGVTAGVLCTAVALLFFWLRREKLGAIDRSQERAGWIFISPWLIGFVVLTFGPMLVSLLLSLSKWTSMQPLSGAEFVGLSNFEHLFQSDASFLKSLWVTFYYAALAVPILQIAALLVAVLMNQAVKGITVFRTIFFVPSVVSGVALATLWIMIFDGEKGILNRILDATIGLISIPSPDWFGVDAEIFAIPAFVIMALWGVGAGMVIYLAGLKGIPKSLYEAARIDGAGRIRQFLTITIPMLSPLIFFNLVMGVIGSFQIFTQVYVMTSGGPGNATLVYVLKLYREAFEYHKMGYASAMAWVLFVVLLAMTLLVVRSSKKWVHYEGLK